MNSQKFQKQELNPKQVLNDDEFAYIAENIKQIKFNIDNAIAKYRKPDEVVRLMAVTKTVRYEAINYAVRQGITLLGENRVQEFLDKKGFYTGNYEINFIGHLQSNKIKYIINNVSLIQSVDSFKLACEIDRQAQKHNKIMDILVEVNIGGEQSKSGVLKTELENVIYQISELKNIKVKGLMIIPPPENSEKYFCEMQELFVSSRSRHSDSVNMELLSMGMSSDYVSAVKYGSNIVRIGTALFGARKYREEANSYGIT